MDAVADSIVANPENLSPQDSSTRKSGRPRKLTAKRMENLSGNVGIVMQALIREVRDETMKQMAKAQQETVKEITTSHERIIETLWNAWKKEQQALKKMIEGQEKAIRQLQKDIQGIQAQAAQERKLMQEQIDELKRINKAQIGEVRQAIEAAVICRDEAELHMVREAARGADIPGVKILRERLYPVKINGANRSAVLDSNDNLLPGVSEALGQENEVTIARMNWLSDKGNGKAYGSMVIYVTKESDARRLVEDRYFHLGGESARTSVFESRASVVQCYNYWRLGHKASVCREAQSEDTTIGNARQQSQCACHVEDGTNHSVGHVDCVKCEEMSTRLQVYQLNVRKNDKVRLSMMNDQDLRDYAALAVAEPWACTIEGQVVTTPNYHSNWTKMIPTKTREPRVSRWPIRSMLWIRRDLEAEQVPIPSPDLTAAIVRFPERDVLAVSVYVEGRNEQALEAAMGQLHRAIAEFRNGSGRRTDVILVGDFNRHDTLWGGDEVTGRRQGEAGPIIELMGEHGLHSLLPRGTKTWEGPGGKTSTIDLALASTELADEMTSCGIHPTEHGSDHRAIWTEFDTKPPERTPSDRLLFKNAPWLEIKERVRTKLEALPCGGTV
ncbi:hypothetical protein FOXB_16661 [Fusarium oxysporum f. sp. conglutinans Fo5176]|uniref:Endonuclease/exonuclease/phosphatase domain-containing protein n=1 Tax=Fusarium oxysporum (strain Fo5176) TaxID=660025 RepID=F9GDC7_FUSOF|nr:hypothetical protein FOXB_16661 [Fusarium oxysporum f. sp. conglutinans Fo5176]